MLQEQDSSSRLLDCLRAEHEAINRHDTDALQQVVADKQMFLARLETSHAQRMQLIRDAGLTSDLDGFDELLAQCVTCGHDLNARWAELKDVLASCQRQNQVNGAVLESSRRTTHRALSILLGGQVDGPELYNQAGKATSSMRGGNRVIKA